MTLYLFKFNNYYNRLVKKFDTIAEYPQALAVFQNINFNPNDGISTEQVVNYQGDIPDYLIACEENVIISRWFVIEAVRTRAQQFNMTLYRDVIADWYNEVINAPMFVEKGYVPTSDPAIYNSEDMTVNQIKTAIDTLKDETECQWIVGYIPRNLADTTFSFDWTGAISTATEVSTLSAWSYYNQLDTNFNTSISKIEVWSSYADGSDEQITCGFVVRPNLMPTFADMTQTRFYNQVTDDRTPGVIKGKDPIINATGTISPQGYLLTVGSSIMLKALQIDYWPNLKTAGPTVAIPGINSQVGKYIKDTSTGITYKVVKQTSTEDKYITISSGTAFNQLKAAFSSPNQWVDATINQPGPFRTKYTVERSTYSLQQVNTNITVDISNRIHTIDSPYDMFCMPYPKAGEWWNYRFDSLDMFVSGELSMSVATSISAALGSEAVYDVQLLPYCPVRNLLNENGVVNSGGPYGSAIRVSETDEVVGHMFWATNSSNTFTISTNMPSVENPIEFKVANQCDFYRLVSPTDGSMFEFSLAKNGPINQFNISFTYKPFSPYIKIAPEFGGLYGETFNWDKRGLILRGDFSLPQSSNAWANYKLNNANYEDIFNRQIESLELQNKYQKQQDVVNAITGTVSAASSGGVTGSFLGGGIGAGIGAGVGALTSGIAGAYDVKINNLLRNEALDLTKDQFGYQLGNIQALPNSLTKVSAFDIDCAPWPIIEYYTCTPVEKQALRNKITYNGMTIMRIDKLSAFELGKERYFKGKLIRIDVSDDYHVASTIANELNKGVFI